MIDDDHIRVCNCAGCGRELVSEKTADLYGSKYIGKRLVIADRHKGRPYCVYCVRLQNYKRIPTRG